MKKCFMFGFAIAMLLAVGFSFAGSTGHQGWYGELGGGSNLYYLGVVSSGDNSFHNGLMAFGANAAIGYQFNPGGVAMEGGMLYSRATKDVKIQGDTQTVKVKGTLSLYAPYLAARWSVPFGSSKFSFIPKVGGMYVYMPKVTVSATVDGQKKTERLVDNAGIVAPFVGVGFNYAATDNLDIALQYQGIIIGVAGAGPLTLGLTYHFA